MPVAWRTETANRNRITTRIKLQHPQQSSIFIFFFVSNRLFSLFFSFLFLFEGEGEKNHQTKLTKLEKLIKSEGKAVEMERPARPPAEMSHGDASRVPHFRRGRGGRGGGGSTTARSGGAKTVAPPHSASVRRQTPSREERHASRSRHPSSITFTLDLLQFCF